MKLGNVKVMLMCIIINVMIGDCNVGEVEYVVEETALLESCEMLVHEVSLPYHELVGYVPPDSLQMIPTSLV